jgi:arylsulfatase A-like enzyme/Flp pilus assembly protein TadD
MKSRNQHTHCGVKAGDLAIVLASFFLSTVRVTSAQTPRPQVILITIDTLRPDRLGCYGNRRVPTSTADQLARDGVVFLNAIAQVPLTLPSHVVILTGTYPMWNHVRDLATTGLAEGIPTLAELFRKNGYVTAAFVSSFVLNSMWGLNRGFDVYDDSIFPKPGKEAPNAALERRASETIDRCLHWLQEQGARPFFLWVHLYDPHAPYNPPEPFKSRFRSDPYDGEVAYADQQLGRLVGFLQAHDFYSGSLILLTSDHGEGLGEHGEQQHGLFVYNSTVHVPLIIKPPTGFEKARPTVAQVVNSVDIAPTLAQFCNFPSADFSSFQGRSLLPLVQSREAGVPRDGYSESIYPRSSFGWHSLHAIETERYHFIDAPQEELYDLERDPGETRNLLGVKASVAAPLREKLRSFETRYERAEMTKDSEPSVDLEKLRELRSLGYVGASPAEPMRGDPPGAADPKDRIGFYNLVMRATELAEDGRLIESNALLARAEAQNPKAYLPVFLLGENALVQGRFKDAKNYYLQTLERNPRYDLAALGLGQAALRMDDGAGAVKAFSWALELNPRNYPAKLALARAYEKQGQFSEAAKLEREVLAAQPGFAQAHSAYGITLVRMKRYAEALPSLLKSIDLGYRSAMTYNFLGTACLAVGREQEGVRAYEEAIRADAAYSAPYGNLALYYARAGERTKSREYLRNACRLDATLCRELSPRIQ